MTAVAPKSLKIIHYNHDAEHYGIGTFLHSLLVQQSRMKELVVAVAFSTPGPAFAKYRDLGIPVYCMDISSARDMKAYEKLKNIFSAYDIVNLHTLAPWAFFAAVRAGCKVVYTFHGALGLRTIAGIPVTRLFVRHLFSRLCHHITFASQASLDHFTGAFGDYALPKGRWSVFPYGSALEAIRPSRSRKEIRESLGIEGAMVVGSAMRLVPVKGPDLLIDAFSSMHYSGRRVLLIMGTGAENYVNSLKDLAGRLGVGEAVLFLGFRDDVYDILAALDVFVMPSRRETFGLALLEAMALGLPCIAMEQGGGVVDILGNSGLLVHGRDGLTVALDQLASDPELRQRLSSDAAGRAARFDISYSATNFLDIYRNIMVQKP